jgi:hypothetical protein
MMEITRRDFVRTSAIGGLAAGAAPAEAFGRAPAIRQASTRPVIISSANGHEFKNGGPVTTLTSSFKFRDFEAWNFQSFGLIRSNGREALFANGTPINYL